MQFLGGALPWPVGVLLTITLRERIGWRGIWIIIGVAALVVFILRFSLPESPRWLATHGQGQRALDLLQRMGIRTPPLESLSRDAASDTRSDPLGIVWSRYPEIGATVGQVIGRWSSRRSADPLPRSYEATPSDIERCV